MGQLGYVMSAQHPLRVAEETAINDHLSNGKYFVGFAWGYQSRWTEIVGQHYGEGAALPPLMGQEPGAAQERAADDEMNRRVFEDNVDLVVKAWTQDLVQHQSPTWEAPYPYENWGSQLPGDRHCRPVRSAGRGGQREPGGGGSDGARALPGAAPAGLDRQFGEPGDGLVRGPSGSSTWAISRRST